MDRYFVLADPAGHREDHVMTAGSARTLAKACRRAEALAQKYGIRFLVARVAGLTDAH